MHDYGALPIAALTVARAAPSLVEKGPPASYRATSGNMRLICSFTVFLPV